MPIGRCVVINYFGGIFRPKIFNVSIIFLIFFSISVIPKDIGLYNYQVTKQKKFNIYFP